MPDVFVRPELLQHLIDEGVCVEPADANGIDPVVFDDPRDGAPEPVGDYQAGTITLTTVGQPTAAEDHSRIREVIALSVRAPTNAQAELIVRAVQAVLTPMELWGGRHRFQMGAIDPVELCLPFRGPQRAMAADDGYQWDLAFEFMVRRKILAGIPD